MANGKWLQCRRSRTHTQQGRRLAAGRGRGRGNGSCRTKLRKVVRTYVGANQVLHSTSHRGDPLSGRDLLHCAPRCWLSTPDSHPWLATPVRLQTPLWTFALNYVLCHVMSVIENFHVFFFLHNNSSKQPHIQTNTHTHTLFVYPVV